MRRLLLLVALIATWAVYAQDDLTRDLLDAASAGDTSRLHADLQAGAKVDFAGKDGRTALMLAAQRGRTDAVKALLAAGANPAIRDASGYTAYGLAVFQPVGHGSRDGVFKLLTPPDRLRFSVIAGWSAQGLVSSCFERRTQVVQRFGLMRPDRMLLQELQAYVKSSGKGLAQIVAVDAVGVDQMKPTPTGSSDAILLLELEPGTACAGGSSDNLTFEIALRVLRGSDASLLLEKHIGGGFKGLKTMKAENAAQYRPMFENWLKEQPSAIYWDTVEILMKSPR